MAKQFSETSGSGRDFKAFAQFFKDYMHGGSTIIVAALPIPVTAFGPVRRPRRADVRSSDSRKKTPEFLAGLSLHWRVEGDHSSSR